ncbi:MULTISPECIES: hypothetical protein [unclassified Rhodanobacter]|uniref:Uncharacterized protein n=1 Tax=Rhodanobacter humi TaxID=1888173 RepID=A0ABV4AV72_9GAMM
MRRLLVPLLLCLLPFAAAGQSVDDANGKLAAQLLKQPPAQMAEVQPGLVVPLWRGTDGRLFVLKADNRNGVQAQRNAPLSFHVVDASSVTSAGLQYGLTPNWQAHADVSQHSWINSPLRVVGSEVGATYQDGRYSLGLSVGTNSTPNSPSLPRVLPGVAPGVDGLSGFDSSSQLNAHGRLALGSKSGIDVGASVGRIHLLPGNLLGISTLDQKAISFGVDHGPVSGSIVGRTMQPLAGVPGNGYAPDRRWNSIDLGVTWRLPWQGSLSVGAQNLWSSGTPANTPMGPEPDQSRTPYVQYHQDL